MNSLIKTTIKRPVTICVLVVILLAVGVLATMDMSTNLLPNIKMPMLGVTAIYPGAAASSVQTDVTDKLENVFKTIPGITELDTRSYDNVSVCILTFDYGTDIDKKIDDIEDALKTVTLPQGCNEPTFSKIDMNGTAAATISLYNDADDIELLAEDADLLATRLRAIEGVGSVSAMGKPQKQIQIISLQGLDITALAIVQALSQENMNLPLGTILKNGAVVSVRNASDATSMLQIMQLPVTMDLGSGALGSLTSLKVAVNTYATCTLDEFNDYVNKALDARKVIDEIEEKTADELEEQYDSLTSLKSLMTLLRENSSQGLRLMWHTIDTSLVQNEEFTKMSDNDLHALADNSNLNLSYDVLKWLQDGAKEGTLKDDWFKLVTFRECMEYAEVDLYGDNAYDHFANLFQRGGSVTFPIVYDPEGNVTHTQTEYYEGLDLLHSDTDHANCETEGADACDREAYTHDDAVKVCEFADSVNTIAYRQIIDAKKEAVDNPDEANDPVISDELFAALFVNSNQGNDFAALMSPQVIHIIRLENFNQDVKDEDGAIVKESIIRVLTEVKQAHVNDDGDAFYKNGNIVTKDDDNNVIVTINGVNFTINGFGRLVDEDGNLIDEHGNVIKLTDEQIEANYYSYGLYRVFDDDELITLYNRLGLDEDMFGITPTLDTVRFIRITDFAEDATTLVVPVAYVGKVQTITAYEAYSQYNGKLAVTLEVYAVADANTTAVVNAVKKAMNIVDVSGTMVLLDDKAEFINDSIMNVLTSIIIGGVLAVLVIYLFVGKVGSSLVVSITMPLSVLVALLGLWAMGISLNMVSLGGLAVGIGMLVDNSIVVLESITKRRDRGENVFDSCLNGTREVAGSLLASTLTNICVFFPILFAKGLTREIFYDLVWAVLFAIVMSLVVAVTVIPSLYHLIYHRSPRPRYSKDKDGNKVFVGAFEDNEPRGKAQPLYDETAVASKKDNAEAQVDAKAEAVTAEADKKGKRKKDKKAKKPVDKAARKRSVLNRMENGYGYILSKVLTKRVVVCVVALVVFSASVGLVFTTGTDFLPSVDKGVIEVNLRFNGAATLDEANEATIATTNAIREAYGDKIQFASYTVGKQGMMPMTVTGVVRIQTDTTKLNTSETVNDIRQLLKTKDINATNITVSEIDGVVAELTGEMAGQSVTLMSDDMSKLAEVASVLAQRLAQIDGIESVTDNTPATNDEISLVFDKDECARRGVSYQNAVLLLRVGMSGYTAATISVNDDSQDVNVIFDDYTKETIEQLLNVVVGFDDDGAIKISDVLQQNDDGSLYTVREVVTNINKVDGKYVTSIDVESYNIDMGTATSRIQKVVNEVLTDYPDVTYQEGGVAHYLTDAMTGLVISLVAAFLLLYGVMACQFESLVKPFVVIMSIPFSFTGGFLALVITETSLNVVSFVGIIMLMGVIVNGAIVMIDKIDQLIKEGVAPREAVLEGCKSRLRPILMTTLTTILALIPLALGLGRGGELMQPMGIVVIGGLLLGTLVTLVLIPCFYCIVKRIKFTSPKNGETTADEPAEQIAELPSEVKENPTELV